MTTYPPLVTIEDYWDCECDDNYIHPKTQTICFSCDTLRNESPDSRLN